MKEVMTHKSYFHLDTDQYLSKIKPSFSFTLGVTKLSASAIGIVRAIKNVFAITASVGRLSSGI